MRRVWSRCQPKNSASGSADFITGRLQHGLWPLLVLQWRIHLAANCREATQSGSQAGLVRQLLRVFLIFSLLDKPFHGGV